jgi:phosphatidylinositol alpha-1,6-mannosyltransferase
MSDRSIRFLVVTVDYPPIEGGISTVAANVSRELASLGHEVTVIAPRVNGRDADGPDPPVRVIRFGGYRLGWLRLLPLVRAAWPHVPHHDFIVCLNVAYGGLFGLLAKTLFGAHYAVFAYGFEFLKFKRVLPVAWLYRLIYGQARKVIAISGFTRESLIEFGTRKTKIVTILPGARSETPVSADRINDVRNRYVLEGRRVILAVGRLVPRKGHLALIRAMPYVLDREPNAHLVVVGRGPAVSSCSREAVKLGVRGHVTFAGRLPDEDVAALYALCDVFALPTGEEAGGHVEGFGLVFAEAQAFGKPVVAGLSGGVTDAVIDGETGLLVEPENPQQLADAVSSLLSNPDLSRRLGENGRRRVERELNWREFTRKLIIALESRP